MSSQSPLDAEELENVPLVRMEDVQPDRSSEKVVTLYKEDIGSDASHSSQDGSLGTFDVDGSELQCVVDDDDSNIGSMVSIKSEEMICEETELIVPEVLDSGDVIEVPFIENEESQSPPPSPTKQGMYDQKPELLKPSPPDRWPTLEILPGGVINLAEKSECSVDTLMADKDTPDVGDMIYACAKCSQGFKYLFCLVKHVRWHEDEAQREKLPEMKLTPIEKKMADLQRRGKEMDKIIKTQNGIVNIKSGQKEKNVKQNVKEKYICLHTGKRKIVSKPKVRRAPKKS